MSLDRRSQPAACTASTATPHGRTSGGMPRASAGSMRRPDVRMCCFWPPATVCLRTTDGGASWRLATDWEVTESQDIAVDPGAPNEVYVGTAYGVWRSRDTGMTWNEANSGLETYVQSLAVDRSDTSPRPGSHMGRRLPVGGRRRLVATGESGGGGPRGASEPRRRQYLARWFALERHICSRDNGEPGSVPARKKKGRRYAVAGHPRTRASWPQPAGTPAS
jgi:hypothetical protein